MANFSLSLNFQFLKDTPLQEMCLICREPFEKETAFVFFKRFKVLGHDKHLFHPDCLKKWLQIEPSCPTCKGGFSLDSLKKVFDKFEESKTLFRRKCAIILGGVATVSSLASRLSFSSLPALGLVSFLGIAGSIKDKDVVKSTAIACATVGFGAIGVAAGFQTEGVLLSGCLGASLADEILKSRSITFSMSTEAD
jgi:hypothetical protein